MGLSRFLQTVLTKTNPLRFLHPDTHICSQIISYNLTDFWLRSSLYRDTAPAGFIDSNNLTNCVYQLAVYRDTRNVHKLCYMTAKTRAMPARLTSVRRGSFDCGLLSIPEQPRDPTPRPPLSHQHPHNYTAGPLALMSRASIEFSCQAFYF